MNRESLISKEDYVFYEDKRIWSKYWEKFLEGRVRKDGYVQVTLKCIDGKQRKFLWHRVIWFAFNGPIPEGYEINHISECKTDNRLSNLECISHLANIRYGTGIERRAAKRRGRVLSEEHKAEIGKANLNGKLSKAVVAVDDEGNVVYEFPSTMEAERNGFNSGAVSACCRNCYYDSNIYKEYYWYYLEDWLKINGG